LVTHTLPSSSASDDVLLMRRIAEGDAGAVRTLYDRHAGLVYSVALKMLRNRDDADELVADVFLELWRKSARYDPTRAAPSTYIVTLARSRCIDRQRRSAARPMLALHDAERSAPVQTQTPADESQLSEQRAAVREALASLEPNQRQAVEAAYFDGLSHSEIAERLGKPLGTIKTHVRLGLIRLRDKLRTINM